MRVLLVVVLVALAASCGPEAKPAKPVAVVSRPSDEAARFPKANLIESKVIDKELLGKAFMPGGTLAHYKKGSTEYDMFVAKMPSATEAAIILPDWNKALIDSKLVPSFGGYFGQDAGQPVFVFSKGAWIAGIRGLPLKDADAQARLLAAQLN